MSVVRAALAAVLEEMERDPALRDRVRGVLGFGAGPVASITTDMHTQFEPVVAFARRISVSERRTWQLVRDGLPTVGAGRSRRVDIERALAWLRGHRQHVDDVVELDARRRARLTAQRKTRRA